MKTFKEFGRDALASTLATKGFGTKEKEDLLLKQKEEMENRHEKADREAKEREQAWKDKFVTKIKESAIPHQKGSESTQVATTTGTYRKTAEKLHPNLKPNSDILDYGAGMGKGAEAMQNVLTGHNVESYEPEPKNWNPTYKSSDEIKKKYPAVVSHNLLNVLEPELRDHVTKHILSLVKPGGTVVVGARGFKGDVNTVKNFTPSESEPNALWVHKKIGKVYQRGFDGDELLNHMKKHGGDDFEFKKVGNLAKSTVIGTRIK